MDKNLKEETTKLVNNVKGNPYWKWIALAV